MYLSKLLHVFVKAVTCIRQICYMYLSKLLHYSWSLRLVGSSRSVGLAADPVAAHIPNQPLHPHGFIIVVVNINIIIDTILSSSIVIITIQWHRTLQTNRSFHTTSSSSCNNHHICTRMVYKEGPIKMTKIIYRVGQVSRGSTYSKPTSPSS